MTRAQRAQLLPWIAIALFALMNLVVLTHFADRDGYEGDDLNSIVPMLHLDDAKLGALTIYRYPWQPLAYEVGAAFIRVLSPTAVFLLSPVCASLSLALLLALVWRDRSSLRELAASLVVLLAVPELWCSGLYYNSTMLGLPFALGALAMLRRATGPVVTVSAGTLTAMAVLMRLDFVLTCPAMAVTAWSGRSYRRLAQFVGSLLTVLLFAYFVGLIRPSEILDVYRTTTAEMAAKAHMPGWDFRLKFFAFTVLLSPIGWVILLLGGPLVVREALHEKRGATVLRTLAFVPLLVLLADLLSPKYVLPMTVFLPSFLMQCLTAIEAKLGAAMGRWPLRVAGLGSVLLLFVSINPSKRPPFIRLSTVAARPIGTHDGARSYGGYLWQAAAVERVAPRTEHQLAAAQIWNDYRGSNGPDIVIVGGEDFFTRGAIGWRHLQLRLEQAGVHGALKGPGRVQFDWNDRRLTLLRETDVEGITDFDRGRGVDLIDLRESSDR